MSIGSIWSGFTSPIPFPRVEIMVPGRPEDVYPVVVEASQGGEIIQRDEAGAIIRFRTKVGTRWFTTLEHVSFDPAMLRVEFRQLESPFFSVRGATEVFELRPAADNATRLSLTGLLFPQWGPIGWIVTRFIVRPIWLRIDRQFMSRVQARRAEQSIRKSRPGY